jgi:hypothetical protein
MAAPHVAGLTALMISADPSLAGELDTLRYRMDASAVPLTSVQTCGGVPGTDIPNNTFGHGRINAVNGVFEEFYRQGFEDQTPP